MRYRAATSSHGIRAGELLRITARCSVSGVITISLHSEVTRQYMDKINKVLENVK